MNSIRIFNKIAEKNYMVLTHPNINSKNKKMITQELQLMINDYFEVIYTQNIELFDKVFYRESVLYTSQEGTVVVRPIAEYREIVLGRKSPKELGSPRKDEILAFDILSEEMAWAKVRLRLNENIMVDYLNLLKIDGKWMVAAKFYHKENKM